MLNEEKIIHHCDHECVCPDYKASHSDEDDDPEPCNISCYNRLHVNDMSVKDCHPLSCCEFCNKKDCWYLNEIRKKERERVSDALLSILAMEKAGQRPWFMNCYDNKTITPIKEWGGSLARIENKIQHIRNGEIVE